MACTKYNLLLIGWVLLAMTLQSHCYATDDVISPQERRIPASSNQWEFDGQQFTISEVERNILLQLLNHHSLEDGVPEELSAILQALMSPSGEAATSSTSVRTTTSTTTTKTTTTPSTTTLSMFERYVIRKDNPYHTMRPESGSSQPSSTTGMTSNSQNQFLGQLLGLLAQTTTPKTTKSTTPRSPTVRDEEADKFDAGFELFSHVFGAGNDDEPIASPLTSGFGSEDFSESLDASSVSGPGALTGNSPSQDGALGNTKNTLTRPPNPDPYPYYYNLDQPETTPSPPPSVNIAQLTGTMVQLVRKDGPALVSGLGTALKHLQGGNYLATLQTAVPAISRTTPLLMRAISSLAPALGRNHLDLEERFDGTDILGRRPFRRRYRQKSGGRFSDPFHVGRVFGSGLKMITYLINFGTYVVRA